MSETILKAFEQPDEVREFKYLGGYPGPFFEFYRGDHHHYDRPSRRKKKD